MICFRDVTFCVAKCGSTLCERKLTQDVERAAERWWGEPGAPIAISDFSKDCPIYFTAENDA